MRMVLKVILINNTKDLDYETIGRALDNFFIDVDAKIPSKEPGSTFHCTFTIGYAMEYAIDVRYLKKDTEYTFTKIRDIPEEEQKKKAYRKPIDNKTKAMAKASAKLVEETRERMKKNDIKRPGIKK